jgi:hypothetical protein
VKKKPQSAAKVTVNPPLLAPTLDGASPQKGVIVGMTFGPMNWLANDTTSWAEEASGLVILSEQAETG